MRTFDFAYLNVSGTLYNIKNASDKKETLLGLGKGDSIFIEGMGMLKVFKVDKEVVQSREEGYTYTDIEVVCDYVVAS
jgi:hypothetical protein